jgi:hypothetical protein
MTDSELDYILKAVAEIVERIDDWGSDYRYDSRTNEFMHVRDEDGMAGRLEEWFRMGNGKGAMSEEARASF